MENSAIGNEINFHSQREKICGAGIFLAAILLQIFPENPNLAANFFCGILGGALFLDGQFWKIFPVAATAKKFHQKFSEIFKIKKN